jgi:ATP-binding cassette subfamily B protein
MSKPNNEANIAPTKPKNMWGTIKRLAAYMKKDSPLILAALVITIAGTLMQVYSPKRLGEALTEIFNGIRSGAGIDFAALGVILLTVALLYAGTFFTTFLQQRLMVLVAQKATYKIRNDLKAKMNRVPVSFFDKNQNGNLMSIASNDVDNIVTNLQQSLTDLITSLIMLVGYLWMMLSISPLLTLLSMLIVPCSVVIMGIITPKTKKYTKVYYKSLGDLNTQIEETYQGFNVVKSFNGESAAIAKFDGVNATMVQKGWKARFFGGLMMPTLTLVQNIIYVLIAIIGAVNVVAGKILIGNMQAFFQYSSGFTRPILGIAQSWSNIIGMVASAERVFDMLDAEEACEYNEKFPNRAVETASNDAGKATEATPKVVFDHLQFGYTDKLLMKDFNMEVEDGQMVAIVGHTGAGKTTLINLLERFYEINGGAIRVDGTDIRNLSRDELRKRMGMVLQDTWLFSGTIYDNIKYGNESATDAQIYAADFIQKMPDGYGTVLNEDADNISQGQKQLITIARAFVSNPEILILDEATSNVDSRTEMVIQSAMKRLLKGRTSFVVAHRLSTIYGADRILVMEGGDIVETGNHEELLAMGGVYADIYNSQFAQSAA